MKNYFYLLSILLLSILSSSCNMQVKKERIQKIDSLGTHLNYVSETINEMDSAMLQNRINHVNNTSAWVYDNIKDTLNRKAGLSFGDFLRSKKYLDQSMQRYSGVKKELNYSEKQLATLREDVKNSFYSEEEFSGFFNTESRSIAELVNATEELRSNYNASNARYEKYKPQVTEVVDSIKTVIYSNEPLAK